MLIGAHVSLAGGLVEALKRGQALGATAIQTFASSPRSLKYQFPEKNLLETYRQLKANSQVKYHVFHGIYLLNLAHEDLDYRQACLGSLVFYQQLAAEIGAAGTVFHLGSHKGKGFKSVLKPVAQTIASILDQTAQKVELILENTAGQNGMLGQSFTELNRIIEAVSAEGTDTTKLKVCLDTQHAFAAGFDLSTPQGTDALLSLIDQDLGLERLSLIHLNESAVELSSHRDRHANLNQGLIGNQGLKYLLNHPALKHLPFILEVPGDNKKGPGKKDLDTLKSWLNPNESN